MKKWYFIQIMFCFLSFPAKAQSSAGIKADVSMSGFLTSQSANLKIRSKSGCSAGFFYNYKFIENVAVQANMMLRYRASEIKNQTTGETADFYYLSVELPLYSLRQAEMDNSVLYFGFGASASYGLTARFQSEAQRINPYKRAQSGDTMLRRWDFGIGFIIGYETKYNLQFNFNCQLGLRNLVNEGFENVEMLSQLISLGAGYRF